MVQLSPSAGERSGLLLSVHDIYTEDSGTAIICNDAQNRPASAIVNVTAGTSVTTVWVSYHSFARVHTAIC